MGKQQHFFCGFGEFILNYYFIIFLHVFWQFSLKVIITGKIRILKCYDDKNCVATLILFIKISEKKCENHVNWGLKSKHCKVYTTYVK